MNIDLSKYEKMRDDGASLMEIVKQLRADGVNDIDFYAALGSLFGEPSFEDARTFIIDEEANKRILIDWIVPDPDEDLVEQIRKKLSHDVENSLPNAKFKTIFLSERAPIHQQTLLASAPQELEIVDSLADAAYLISERRGKIDAAFLDKAPKLKMILRLGNQSHDIDLDASKARGIAVTTWPQASVGRVAEHAILQMLALTKRLNDTQKTALEANNFGRESNRTDENTFAYNWSKREGIGSIFGKSIGILGLGEIGYELAKRLQNWGATLLYHKRQRLPEAVEAQYQLRYESDLFSNSDILVNLLPYNEETDSFINAERLASMKSSAFLVSVGSGATIDESALAHAIESQKVAGAALDTYEYEPLRLGNPLLALARNGYNLILTPHIAAGTADIQQERRESFSNILRHIEGKELLNRLV